MNVHACIKPLQSSPLSFLKHILLQTMDGSRNFFQGGEKRGEGYLCFPGGGAIFDIILLRKFQKFEFFRGEGSGVPTPVLDLHIQTLVSYMYICI